VLAEEGVLTEWSEWVCDVACGPGNETRKRECLPKYPETYDTDCPLDCEDDVLEETVECDAGDRKFYLYISPNVSVLYFVSSLLDSRMIVMYIFFCDKLMVFL